MMRFRPEAPRGMARAYRMARVAAALCWLPMALCACAAAPAAPEPAAATAAPPVTRSVHVVSHGWHTGLVLRAGDVSAAGWPAKADFPDAAYLEVGWGDREYYRAADPGAWLALKALTWPRPGVLHVVAVFAPETPSASPPRGGAVALGRPGGDFAGTVERLFGGAEIIEIGVSEAGLRRLIDHVRNSHELDAAGRPIALGPGLYGRSRFYASHERFHLLKTCNVWVATALQAAGVPVTPALAITAGQLMAQLRPLARVPENRPPGTAPPHSLADVPERP